MDYMVDFVEAKYHLAVARRMLDSYGKFSEKRFLVGVVRELAKSVRKLIRGFLIREGFRGRDWRGILVKYLDSGVVENLGLVLEIEREQRVSRVEFLKDGKFVLLVGGKYKILTVDRIREFVGVVDLAIKSLRDGVL